VSIHSFIHDSYPPVELSKARQPPLNHLNNLSRIPLPAGEFDTGTPVDSEASVGLAFTTAGEFDTGTSVDSKTIIWLGIAFATAGEFKAWTSIDAQSIVGVGVCNWSSEDGGEEERDGEDGKASHC
jgi:hypothetical protein